MIVYETADGQLWSWEALIEQTLKEAKSGWDQATQGPFEFDSNEWLIEAKLSGVVKEREVTV